MFQIQSQNAVEMPQNSLNFGVLQQNLLFLWPSVDFCWGKNDGYKSCWQPKVLSVQLRLLLYNHTLEVRRSPGYQWSTAHHYHVCLLWTSFCRRRASFSGSMESKVRINTMRTTETSFVLCNRLFSCFDKAFWLKFGASFRLVSKAFGRGYEQKCWIFQRKKGCRKKWQYAN